MVSVYLPLMSKRGGGTTGNWKPMKYRNNQAFALTIKTNTPKATNFMSSEVLSQKID